MEELNLDNIISFKAVDVDGNEQNVTVDDMVSMISARMASTVSKASPMSAEMSTYTATAATGNDVYENELPIVSDYATVRVVTSDGTPAQATKQTEAKVVEGLLPVASANNNGLMNINGYRGSNSFAVYNLKPNDFVKLFSLSKYAFCIFNIIMGNTADLHQNIASVYLNNRCQGSLYYRSKLLHGTLQGLYTKREDDDKMIFYLKIPVLDYPTCVFSFQLLPQAWDMSIYGEIDNSVTESDLTFIM